MPPAISHTELTNISFQAPLSFVELRENKYKLKYHHYSVPLCVHPRAWRPLDGEIKLSTHANGSPVNIPCNHAGDEHYSTDDATIFRDEVTSNTPEILSLYESRRRSEIYYETSLPEAVRDTIHNNGKTIDAALAYIHHNWQNIDQFGPKRTHKLLYTDIDDTGTPDNHDDVAMVACPACNEGFWKFIHNDHTLDSLHTRDLYCPCCHHNIIQSGCVGHERIPVDAFETPPVEPPFPEIAPHSPKELLAP